MVEEKPHLSPKQVLDYLHQFQPNAAVFSIINIGNSTSTMEQQLPQRSMSDTTEQNLPIPLYELYHEKNQALSSNDLMDLVSRTFAS